MSAGPLLRRGGGGLSYGLQPSNARFLFFFQAADGIRDRDVTGFQTCALPILACQRLSMIGVECVARGYLAGSGWHDYRRTGAVCGVALPPGLTEGARLPEPIFTPATKEIGRAWVGKEWSCRGAAAPQRAELCA